MFNKSTVSKYLISYYGPKKVIGKYGFDVELMFKLPVSMHGSGEGHTGYYYRRVAKKEGKVRNNDIDKIQYVRGLNV